MAEYEEFNRKIIEEFRANGGKVGGNFEGAPMLILHTTGAKTGQERVHPLVHGTAPDGAVVVFASKGGAPSHPAWYLNLLANPDATIEIGTETRRVRARVAEGDEREQLWSHQKQLMPGFADYEQRTTREIPVVVLEPTG
jgi:deazaflavin-dependent oxidoreductase (nitroreductase family)